MTCAGEHIEAARDAAKRYAQTGDRAALRDLKRAGRAIARHRPEVGAVDLDKTRQQVSWRLRDDGAIVATMRVTLPDGSERVYTAAHRDTEVAGAWALSRIMVPIMKELGKLKGQWQSGEISKAEYERLAVPLVQKLKAAKDKKEGINLGAVGKAIGKVADVAKKGLAVAALVTPPPINAAAAGAAATIAVAQKLGDKAKPAVEAVKGAKELAESLAPKSSGAVLAAANKKRHALDAAAARTVADAKSAQAKVLAAVLAQRKAQKAKAAAKAAKHKRRKAEAKKKKRTSTDALAAARRGLLRSPTGGKVTPAELVRAHAGGRVYWVSA